MQPYHTTAGTRPAGRLECLLQRHERWMYRGRRPNRVAAVLNRLWAMAGRRGIWRSRLVTLEVAGRRSGRATAVPLIVADLGGARYLVAMLGERADWVANVRAAGGFATLRHGDRELVRLVEVHPAERAPILRRHLEVAPAARSFFAVDRTGSDAELAAVARAVPIFRIAARD